ncbi:MAG: addiction module antidote protein, HigA family [Gammaproteobacteria bacterium]|nr:MAG: addiction module antidote protein, HigA family [Gammaproteobacteria bacterium]
MNKTRQPTHPGEVLREDVLPTLGVSVSQAARDMRISRQQLHRILACTHPITPEMAVKIGKYCGNGPRLWLNMQTACDLHAAEKRLAKEIKQIPTAVAA